MCFIAWSKGVLGILRFAIGPPILVYVTHWQSRSGKTFFEKNQLGPRRCSFKNFRSSAWKIKPKGGRGRTKVVFFDPIQVGGGRDRLVWTLKYGLAHLYAFVHALGIMKNYFLVGGVCKSIVSSWDLFHVDISSTSLSLIFLEFKILNFLPSYLHPWQKSCIFSLKIWIKAVHYRVSQNYETTT